MAGSPQEEQQHTADDEQRADSDGCQRGNRAAILGVFLFSCKSNINDTDFKLYLQS